MKKIAKVLTICLILWFLWSWVDVTNNNCNPNGQVNQYNAFVVLFNN